MDLPICTSKLLDQDFGMSISSDSLIVPFRNFFATNYFRPWKIGEENLEKEIGSTIENTKENFKIMLDVQHFKPDEMSVKLINNEVFVKGKHEERKDDHGFISRQFTRRYALPKDCFLDTINSALSSDGVLIITAKKISEKEKKASEKIVPIKMCGPSTKKEDSNSTTTAKAEIETTKSDFIETKTESREKSEIIKTDIIQSKSENSNDKQVMLKEEHSRLLKPEFMKDAVLDTVRLIKETKLETENLLKLISSDKANVSGTAEKLEDAIDQCKSTIAEIKEKMSETSKANLSEAFSAKCSMKSESSGFLESSSFMSSSSSTTSTLKATSETANELLITDELKEAAEYIS